MAGFVWTGWTDEKLKHDLSWNTVRKQHIPSVLMPEDHDGFQGGDNVGWCRTAHTCVRHSYSTGWWCESIGVDKEGDAP